MPPGFTVNKSFSCALSFRRDSVAPNIVSFNPGAGEPLVGNKISRNPSIT
jgi:hypothetical protein